MLNISVSATKERGRPKGRPNLIRNKTCDQIVYPNEPPNQAKLHSWFTGLEYRKATGELKGNVRFQPDLYN